MTPNEAGALYTWTVVRLPERALAESILHLAAPLLDPPGQAAAPDEVRHVLKLAISTWNAHPMASPLWGRPTPRPWQSCAKRCVPQGGSP